MTKSEIRAEMRRRRKQVAPCERAAVSAKICKRLIDYILGEIGENGERGESSRPSRPLTVAVYLAASDEIDLTPFIEHCLSRPSHPVSPSHPISPFSPPHPLRLVAPRWNGANYELAELNGCWPNGLVEGPHAILEPPQSAPRIDASEVATWLVPGLAFAQDGARLGYGGGWYDRLMSGSGGRKIGVGHRFQLVGSLPSEPHDIRVDTVVCG